MQLNFDRADFLKLSQYPCLMTSKNDIYRSLQINKSFAKAFDIIQLSHHRLLMGRIGMGLRTALFSELSPLQQTTSRGYVVLNKYDPLLNPL